jgi:hypothetical protein
VASAPRVAFWDHEERHLTTDTGVDRRTILLAGLPRSGTTLACELLGSLPDTVALDEPIDGPTYTAMAVDGPLAVHTALDVIARFVAETRTSLRERGVARSNRVDGRVVGRKVSDERGLSGRRVKLATVGELRVDKALSSEFLLIVKHNSGFVALLPELANGFRMHGVVRNPLLVLSSWQSVPFPIGNGRIPLGERLNASLAASLDRIGDPLDRQYYLLGWFFGALASSLGTDAIVRYEDVIATSGRCLTVIAEGAASLTGRLEDSKSSHAHPRRHLAELGRRLLDTDGDWWRFYTPEDVSMVMTGDQ